MSATALLVARDLSARALSGAAPGEAAWARALEGTAGEQLRALVDAALEGRSGVAQAAGGVALVAPLDDHALVLLAATPGALGELALALPDAPARAATGALASVAFEVATGAVAARAARESRREVRELLALAAHDVRTPLTVVLAASDDLSYGDALGATDRMEIAGEVREAGNLISRIIDDVIDLARLGAGELQLEPREASLRSIVAHAIERATQGATQRGVTIELAPGDEITAVIDGRRLEQIVDCLVAAAVKSTPTRGVVRVDARRDGERLVLAIGEPAEGPGNLHGRASRAFSGELGARLVTWLGGEITRSVNDRGAVRFDASLPLGPADRTTPV